MATLVLSDAQKCALTVSEADAKGAVVPAGPSVVFASSDESVAKFQDDGGVQKLFAQLPGTCQVSAVDGSITGTLDVQVTAGPPVAINVVPGTIEEQ